MSKLTKTEKAWIAKLQAVLDECPSGRIGFYTIGDPDVSIYDTNKQGAIDAIMDNSNTDYGNAVRKAGASFDADIKFPSHVHSVAG